MCTAWSWENCGLNGETPWQSRFAFRKGKGHHCTRASLGQFLRTPAYTLPRTLGVASPKALHTHALPLAPPRPPTTPTPPFAQTTSGNGSSLRSLLQLPSVSATPRPKTVYSSSFEGTPRNGTIDGFFVAVAGTTGVAATLNSTRARRTGSSGIAVLVKKAGAPGTVAQFQVITAGTAVRIVLCLIRKDAGTKPVVV